MQYPAFLSLGLENLRHLISSLLKSLSSPTTDGVKKELVGSASQMATPKRQFAGGRGPGLWPHSWKQSLLPKESLGRGLLAHEQAVCREPAVAQPCVRQQGVTGQLGCWPRPPLGAWPLLVCPCKGSGRFTFFTQCSSIKFWHYLPGVGLPRWH